MSDILAGMRAVNCHLNRELSISDLDWEIHRGQHWVVLGANGSGKTAIAKILGGMLPIAAGELVWAEDIAAGKGIAYVSFDQQAELCEHDRRFDDSELREDAFDPGTLARDAILQGRQPDARFDYWVGEFRLATVLDRGIRFISSGEMRKVLLLRALISAPTLLVLDNPLEGLDRASQHDMGRLVQALMRDDNAVILLSRRREDILPGFTHLAILRDLKMVASGTRQQVEQGVEFRSLYPPLPPPPARLPTPDPMLARFIPPAGEALVTMRDISVSYQGDAVMRGIDFALHPGQHTSISGPNGCGKSTLLSLMTGDNHKAYGQDIVLFGVKRGSGESVWDIKRRFGLVSNSLHQSYISGWTTLEVVISGLYDTIGLYQRYGGCEEKTAREWLAALALGHLAATLFRKLSYGQQRMVLLARAMAKYPPVLVLDEPCTGLDEYNRQLFLRTLDLIAQHTDTTLVFVSHLPGEIPACIQQELVFEPDGSGLYRLVRVAR
jgi:molybdate transport system ATP-binding protein